jgi:thiamine-phosphate pyrophosphorylase
MRIGRLHVLTDAAIQSRFDHVQLAAMAVRGGADVIQYRRKDGTTRELIREARMIREITRRAGISLIVNDRVDVALAADADGVHLGTEDFPISVARRLLGPHRILGGSGGSVSEVTESASSGADYLNCGPIYATSTKPDAGSPTGPSLLRAVAARVEVPLIAIGGITHSHVAEVLRGGAHGIAVIAAVCASADPEGATRELRAIIDATIEAARTGGMK